MSSCVPDYDDNQSSAKELLYGEKFMKRENEENNNKSSWKHELMERYR